MNKKHIFAILVILMVFAGCKGKEAAPKTDEEPFVGGTTGLLMDFIEDSPPTEVTDGGNYPFDIVVKIKNDGEYFIAKEDATVKISGILPEDFNKEAADLTKNPDEDLEETKKDSEGNVLEGTITHVEFKDFNYLGTLSGNTPFTFRVDICYKYGTTANAKLCVLEDLLKAENSDVCKVNEKKTVHNSGAPVQITGFEENVRSSDKVAFSFKIVHKGNGDIYKQGTGCSKAVRTDKDKVYVTVDTGIAGLSCSGLSDGTATTGYINLYGGERTIICTQETTSITTDFEKVTTIELEYDYKEDKQTGVLVKHLID